MPRVSPMCAAAIATVVIALSLSDAKAQRRNHYGGRLNTQRLVQRIEELERRVTILERLDGPQHPDPLTVSEEGLISVEDAEQLVAVTSERQVFSERLFRKGYVSEAEMETDRYDASRAIKLLELAEATRDGNSTAEIMNEMDVLEAQHNLEIAKRQLRLAEELTARGLLGTGLPAHRRAVEDAQRELDATQTSAAQE